MRHGPANCFNFIEFADVKYHFIIRSNQKKSDKSVWRKKSAELIYLLTRKFSN
jgi:hypothetical protein